MFTSIRGPKKANRQAGNGFGACFPELPAQWAPPSRLLPAGDCHASTLWQPGQRAIMFRLQPAEVPVQMNQPTVRLFGFVVLAAIVLATGFGALG